MNLSNSRANGYGPRLMVSSTCTLQRLQASRYTALAWKMFLGPGRRREANGSIVYLYRKLEFHGHFHWILMVPKTGVLLIRSNKPS